MTNKIFKDYESDSQTPNLSPPMLFSICHSRQIPWALIVRDIPKELPRSQRLDPGRRHHFFCILNRFIFPFWTLIMVWMKLLKPSSCKIWGSFVKNMTESIESVHSVCCFLVIMGRWSRSVRFRERYRERELVE